MTIGTAQEVLFGESEKFPRRVGVPFQWHVFSRGEFDLYVDRVNGHSNAYAAVCYRDEQWDLVLDKVSIDLDTPMKQQDEWTAFEDDPEDDEVVARMRGHPDLAEDILGEVCSDVRSLAEACEADNIPAIGVFSGFGVHFHMLFEPRKEPVDAYRTTSSKYLQEASVRTFDHKVSGDVKRILRVPNCARMVVDDDNDRRRNCGLYTVPLTRDEMKDITAQDLMVLSTKPRSIPKPEDERKPLEYHEEYDDQSRGLASNDIEVEQRELQESSVSNNALEFLLKEYLRMPCMYERIMQPNPDHMVRLNCAVLLFNLGLEPSEVHSLYSQIGWIDYDPKTTGYQLKNIYRNGYGDMSCIRLREEGLCTRVDDPTSCETFGWSGGKPEWKN